ncbi:cupredoxin domain-containing protein [Paenibacillus glycinis]|uniref:EfeO-type cupredoxin-like domain-containing protein n=1 Tax=Paenibacillus glycinis TaxID=2697035 RepID=A0ABW9XSR0_9BACL|nr:cupredoxin domain-containing protein [Paenibacillus glycinis]NBD25689.1 hypothetical protein [Paenibacillus glycinis]
MLFNTGSLLLVGVIELYFIFIGFQKRSVWSKRTGTRMAAAVAVPGSFAFGTIMAQSYDLPLITLLAFAVLFGAAAGVLGGSPYGPRAATNGGLAGSIAGMLGTVLGSLFFGSGQVVLAAALTFVVIAFLALRIAERAPGSGASPQKAAKGKPKAAIKASYRSAYVLAACAVVCFAGILLLQDRLHLGAIGLPQTQTAVMDDENDLQVATIDVTGAGFAPKVTEFQANAMIKVIFNVKASAGNGLKIVSKDLNFSADVKPGQNIFLLNNPQPGDYAIEVGSKGYAGTFTVKPAAKL